MLKSHDLPQRGKLRWVSPSNIALIKYWGKKPGTQLPASPSLSMTLQNCVTDMELSFERAERPGLEVYFEGKEKTDFAKKIQALIDRILPEFPELAQLHLRITSTNSFPHSAGIASSASSMSALALCLLSLKKLLAGVNQKALSDEDKQLASKWARLGSGSACRSIFPQMAIWGQTPAYPASTDLKASSFHDFHPDFQGMKDAILLVDIGQKAVSSSQGHKLMDDHPYKDIRYSNTHKDLEKILASLKAGEWMDWGEIVEREALALHSLMMTSHPSFILMRPQTLAIIERIREFRKQTTTPVFFTLDAGPNVHMLYPSGAQKKVEDFLRRSLVEFLHEGKWIADEMGEGPYEVRERD